MYKIKNMDSGPFSRRGKRNKHRKSSSSYVPKPPKILTPEEKIQELKLKIAGAPNNILDKQNNSKDNLKFFYIYLVVAIVLAIVVTCVNLLVPHTYEEVVKKKDERGKVISTKETNTYDWIVIFYVFSILGMVWLIASLFGSLEIYKSYIRDAIEIQNDIPKWQSQLNSLTAAAPSG